MLDLEQIAEFYPEHLRPFKRNLLREYLQYKILEAIYSSRYGEHLSFMGGTAIHILHGNPRFSEDLDFDNRGLDRQHFEELGHVIQKRLELEGYTIEISTSYKKAFRLFIGVKELLYRYRLSAHKAEKIHIQIDAEPQHCDEKPETYTLNKFDVFVRIRAVPCDTLLSQKISAIFTRKRPMGRDFFDTIFLMGKTKPNTDYLSKNLDIHDMPDLRKNLAIKCSSLNFSALARDVEPFLFIPADSKKILGFPDLIRELK